MKRTITIFSLLVIFVFTTFAKKVDENTAKTVAQNFLTSLTKSQALVSGGALNLVYTAKSKASSSISAIQTTNFFYIFNTGETGFILVAADDIVIPILGYSDEGIFNANNIPPNVAKWLEGYKNQIRYAIDNEMQATDEISALWQSLLTVANASKATKGTTAVNPLVQTKWDQSPNYNALCPYEYQYSDRTVTGCVATAMAQVMKYWNYPATGSGFHSYNHSKYGTLSANFGSTTYQWSSMPNMISGANSAIATIMYHCGVSVDMDYNVGSQGGSGAYVISAQSPVTNCSEYALKTYFGYKSTLQGKQRSSYTDTQWKSLLKAELDANRPIIYAGFGSGGGHCFINDGYDIYDYFHFNWGWSGQYDGYFAINALNPGGVGTGGGTGGFNTGHQAVIGIEPPSGGPSTANLVLYNYVTLSANPLYYGNAFTVTTNIANSGTSTFNGDYCAAIFDNAYNFVDFVEIKTGFSLQAGYHYTNNLVFSTTGIFGMLPGTYYIGIFYRPTGGNWFLVSNSGSYVNSAQMNVINPNDIELNSSMTVTPGTTLTQGQSASVNLNIVNDGATTFFGQYQVNLYELDGSFVQTINTITENNGLPSGYTYLSPYLTFTTSSITAAPGTYLLAAIHKPNSSSSWQLTGSSYYLNPIKVTVKLAAISPDPYEANNTIGQAYTLPVTFSGNNATRNTVGSNCHIGSDYDYYKINFPAGYTYTIVPRIHDSYNSGNGNTYTLDALFSYSTDGSTWSDAFDDIMSGSVTVNGAGTIYFHVSPFFTGETGTYLLDMTITRTPTTGIDEIDQADLITLFPNPTKGVVFLDLRDFNQSINEINILNLQGQSAALITDVNNKELIPVSLLNLSDGIYFIQLQTSSGLLTKKIILER